MKYPKLKDMKNILSTVKVEQVFSFLKHCMKEIHDGDKIYNRIDITDKDIEEFIDQLSTEQLQIIIEFF